MAEIVATNEFELLRRDSEILHDVVIAMARFATDSRALILMQSSRCST